MTNFDTPDYQRGVVAAQHLLAAENNFTGTITVTVPPNVEALWVFGYGITDPPPTATGVTSGYEYPCLVTPTVYTDELAWQGYVFPIAAALDSEITVDWHDEQPLHWYVVGCVGGPFLVDVVLGAALGTPGQGAPLSAVQVAGTDGTDTRVLLTDSTGKLLLGGSIFPAVYGPTGATVPADALLVGGTDGTDLRALAVDSSGHQLTIDQNLKSTIGTPGSADPSEGVQIAGSDGTDLRVLLLDSSGHQLTIDQNLKLVIGALATALPADAVLVAGSDGTDMRALLLDSSGHQLTVDQNVKNVVAAINTATPADAILVAGSDGTDIRPLLTDHTGILSVVDSILQLVHAQIGSNIPSQALAAGVSDGTLMRMIRSSALGVPYVTPTAPNTAAGDHPPVELIVASFSSSTDFQIMVAAPGAGKRIRLFSAELMCVFPTTGTQSAFLYDNVTNTHMCYCLAAPGGSFPGTFRGYPSGVPLSTNAGLEISNNAAGQLYFCTVVYTIETV